MIIFRDASGCDEVPGIVREDEGEGQIVRN